MTELERKEFLTVIRGLMSGSYGSEQETDAKLEFLQSAFPAAFVSDLIFYGDPDDTEESILEKMIACKPVIMPSS